MSYNPVLPKGQATMANSNPIVLASDQSAIPVSAGTNLNTSLLALESGGNLAAIKAKTDNIPALGQALAAASLPVILPAATVTTLTPPAAITGFATEAKQLADGHNVTVDNSTGAAAVNIQDGGNTITVDGTVAVTNADITSIKTAVEILDNVVSGSEAQVDIVAALPAGTNAIGKLAANSGVDIGDVDVTSLTGGGVADNGADSGNPVKIGGKYNLATQTYADGDRADLQVTANGYLRTTLSEAISGEDQTNDVLKVEGQFSYSYLTADGQVKASAGFLHSITFSPTDAAATAGSIIVYDNTAESGTVVFTYYIPAAALVPVTVILDIKMLTGIYVGYTTTADVCTTVSYR